MGRPCPLCSSVPGQTKEPPCNCQRSCECHASSHGGAPCGAPARGWGFKKAKGWVWHRFCLACDLRCSRPEKGVSGIKESPVSAGAAPHLSSGQVPMPHPPMVPPQALGVPYLQAPGMGVLSPPASYYSMYPGPVPFGGYGLMIPGMGVPSSPSPASYYSMPPGPVPSGGYGLTQGKLFEHEVVASARGSLVDRLRADPVKKRRLEPGNGAYLYDRVRGAGKPSAPLGLVIFEMRSAVEFKEVGDVLITWTNLLDGNGRLHQSALLTKEGQEMVRVAFSLAMLIERELVRVLGGSALKASLRSQKFDVWTNYQTFGATTKGTSVGTVMTLTMVQAMTECAFHDKICTTGAVSLTGRVLKVDGIGLKAEGASKAGQTRVVLPEQNRADVEALPRPLRQSLDVHMVSDVAGLLRASVSGWGRLRSLQLPQRDVASIDVPMTFKGQDWVATVEAAVVPGHGQVHMTGDGLDETLIDAFNNVLVWARTHQEEVVALLEEMERDHSSGSPVRLLVDLRHMRYTEHHPWAEGAAIADSSLDLHIHLPTGSRLSREPGYAAPLGVVLACLMTGCQMPTDPKVAVLGSCTPSGVVGLMHSEGSQRLWQWANESGFGKLLLNRVDFDRSMDPQFGGPVDMTAVPTVRVKSMMEVLSEVFGA